MRYFLVTIVSIIFASLNLRVVSSKPCLICGVWESEHEHGNSPSHFYPLQIDDPIPKPSHFYSHRYRPTPYVRYMRPAGLEMEYSDYGMGRSIINSYENQNVVKKPSAKKTGTLDFGLNRGYTGAQASKILMGQAAANNPWGPGRRRRSVDRENHFNSGTSSKAYDTPAEGRQLKKIGAKLLA